MQAILFILALLAVTPDKSAAPSPHRIAPRANRLLIESADGEPVFWVDASGRYHVSASAIKSGKVVVDEQRADFPAR